MLFQTVTVMEGCSMVMLSFVKVKVAPCWVMTPTERRRLVISSMYRTSEKMTSLGHSSVDMVSGSDAYWSEVCRFPLATRTLTVGPVCHPMSFSRKWRPQT